MPSKAKKPNKGNTSNRKYTVAQMHTALVKAGTILGAAKIIGCDRNTVKRYMIEHPELEEAKFEATDNLLDIAENQLMKNVKKGHASSIFFTLKTLGKERGYIERSEHSGTDGTPLFSLDGAKQSLKDKFNTSK